MLSSMASKMADQVRLPHHEHEASYVDCTVDVRRKALDSALSLTAGAYQTSLVSYFSHRDLFPALMKVFQSPLLHA